MKKIAKSPGLAQVFSALADPTRLRLLNLIAGHEVCVCYLVEILQQSQSKISRHLAYLRGAGIVRARREGKWMHYSLLVPEAEAVKLVLDAVLAAFRQDAAMQADLRRLERASRQTGTLVALEGAPRPVSIPAMEKA